MTDKLSTYDVLMYVLPGAALLTALAIVAWLADPTALRDLPILGEGGILASVLFVLLAVVAGLIVQALAVFIDHRVRSKADLPWMMALQGRGDTLSSVEHREVLDGLQTHQLLHPEERDRLASHAPIARLVYGRARDAALQGPHAARIQTARAYFLLNRGLAMVALLMAALLASGWLLWVVSLVIWLLGTVLTLGFWDAPWPFSWPAPWLALASTVVSGGVGLLLGDRALDTDRSHARIVLFGAARGPDDAPGHGRPSA